MKICKEGNFLLLNLIGNIIIISLLMLSIAYITISNEYKEFDKKTKEIEKEFFLNQKNRLKIEVDRVIDYINYYKSQTELKLKKEIKNRVYQAYSIANYIYLKYKDKEKIEKIKERIKDALSPIRWRNGFSYLWIVDKQGTAVMFPLNPNIENKNILDYKDTKGRYIIREAISIASSKNEGYITKIFVNSPSNREIFEQIAFIKYFKPFDWIIGTGETINDVEKDIKKDILARIQKIRFNKEGYFGVIDYNGKVLSHPFLKIGTDLLHTKPYIEIGKKFLNIDENGEFLIYKFRKLTENKITKKLTYAKPIDDWGWIIYAGVYLDELQKKIDNKKEELNKELKRKIKILSTIFIIFFLIALIISIIYTKKLNDIFNRYKKKIEYRSKKLEQLNKELKEKEIQAKKANRAKTLFISNISHDIRTPLNAILGYAQILKNDQSLNSIQKEKIEKILKQGHQLLELLDDIIEISKIEIGNVKLNKENFDLKNFLENIKELYEDKAKSKGLKWEVIGIPNQEVFVKADKKKLFRVLINLISNAFKYTDFGKVILKVEKKDNNRYRFSVIDTGIGIEKKDQKDIFEIFTQAQPGEIRGGKGLGLSIAYRYVKLLGGELKLISKPKKGSNFYFEITLEPSIQKNSNKKNIEKNETLSKSFKINKDIKKNILELAKIGDIIKLKKEISKLESNELKSKLLEYVNSFDFENLIDFIKNIKEKY